MMPPVGGDLETVWSAEAAASLIGWWLDAGVDVAIAEEPRDWLGKSPLPATGVADGIVDESRSVPVAKRDTLEDFHAWLNQASDLPLFHAGAARALPHGPANAGIMLISDLPGRECAAEGRPIGGEAWQLTVRMLAAIGFKPDEAYVASLSCFPTPGQRIDPAALERCASIMREHIALVAPRRLLLLGDGPAKALTGQSAVQARGRIHRIDGIPAVATMHPRLLLERPQDKAHAWRDLLLLMSEEVS
jgi:DNA polymerase